MSQFEIRNDAFPHIIHTHTLSISLLLCQWMLSLAQYPLTHLQRALNFSYGNSKGFSSRCSRCNWMNDDCYWWHVDIAASLHFITARWWIDMLCFIAGWLVRLRVYIVFIECRWWGSSIGTQTISRARFIASTSIDTAIATDTNPHTHAHTLQYRAEQVAHKL